MEEIRMKKNPVLFSKLFAIMLFGMITMAVHSQKTIDPYLGRWALYLPNGAGWLEVRQEKGYFDADILWYSGSVVPVDNAYLI